MQLEDVILPISEIHEKSPGPQAVTVPFVDWSSKTILKPPGSSSQVVVE
jgi:hypothetical protein